MDNPYYLIKQFQLFPILKIAVWDDIMIMV